MIFRRLVDRVHLLAIVGIFGCANSDDGPKPFVFPAYPVRNIPPASMTVPARPRIPVETAPAPNLTPPPFVPKAAPPQPAIDPNAPQPRVIPPVPPM